MAEEKILNNAPAEEVIYDDAAEQEKYLAKRKQQMEEDFAKPFDPEAVQLYKEMGFTHWIRGTAALVLHQPQRARGFYNSRTQKAHGWFL